MKRILRQCIIFLSSNNTHYAVTEFRLMFEIRRRISRYFDREPFKQIHETTSSFSYTCYKNSLLSSEIHQISFLQFPGRSCFLVTIDMDTRLIEFCLVLPSNNLHYAVTKFRFRIEIQRRIYRNFVRELFENVLEPTSNIP